MVLSINDQLTEPLSFSYSLLFHFFWSELFLENDGPVTITIDSSQLQLKRSFKPMISKSQPSLNPNMNENEISLNSNDSDN